MKVIFWINGTNMLNLSCLTDCVKQLSFQCCNRRQNIGYGFNYDVIAPVTQVQTFKGEVGRDGSPGYVWLSTCWLMSAHTKHIIGLLARVRIVSRGVDSYKHPLYSGTPQNNKIITCCTEFPHSIGALGNCHIMTKMRSMHTYQMSGCYYYSG